MIFYKQGITYAVDSVTSIASCNNGLEEKRQDALLVTADNGTEKTEHIVFGWTMPEDEEAFDEMCEDVCAWEPLDDSHKVCLSPPPATFHPE